MEMNGKSQSRSHGGTEPNQDVNESNWLVTASKDRSPAKTREGERERERSNRRTNGSNWLGKEQ